MKSNALLACGESNATSKVLSCQKESGYGKQLLIVVFVVLVLVVLVIVVLVLIGCSRTCCS